MARVKTRKQEALAETETREQVEAHEPARPATNEYIERNRAAWDRWAPHHAPRARKAWEETELRWGLWDTPESELQLLRDLPAKTDAIELGCGTAAISAGLARRNIRPVAVDISREQLKIAEQLQYEFRLSFPLIDANAEEVPFDDASFDVAISEYGASIWADPRVWIPEAARILRPGGELIFLINSTLLMLCMPDEERPATKELIRPLRGLHRLEWSSDQSVNFALSHGDWIRVLRQSGFAIENLVELWPADDATTDFPYITPDWARQWPTEEVWIARRER